MEGKAVAAAVVVPVAAVVVATTAAAIIRLKAGCWPSMSKMAASHS